jgi:hypothetical protein
MHEGMSASAMHNGVASASVNKRVATTASMEGHSAPAYVSNVGMATAAVTSAAMASSTVPTTGAGLKR